MSPGGLPVKILLVEDNPGDVRLTKEAFKMGNLDHELITVPDGEEALAYLHEEGDYENAPRPDLILLDLNLPKRDGREVLEEIKNDETLRTTPVVVLTTSEAEQDILRMYELQANCYITKPVDLDEFLNVIQAIETFWLATVKLPTRATTEPARG